MRIYQYILIFLLFSIVARVYYIIYKIKKQLKDIKGIVDVKGATDVKEGFESLDSCLWQGYPTQFCKRAPLQACLTNCGENYQ
jgi:hypothetical protein